MIALVPALSAIVLAMTPAARQVVQSAPSGSIGVSRDGYVAMLEGGFQGQGGLHFWHLDSRSLVRTVPMAALDKAGGVRSDVPPVWDHRTLEAVLARHDGGVLYVDLEGRIRERAPAKTIVTSCPSCAIGNQRASETGTTWLLAGGSGFDPRWITGWIGIGFDVRDDKLASLGKLEVGHAVAVSGDGDSAVVLAKDSVIRYELAPVKQTQRVSLPAPADPAFARTVALDHTGSRALACVQKGNSGNRVVLVRDLRGTPTVKDLDFPVDIFGCMVSISGDVGVVTTLGALYGFDLATGARRWQAPAYGTNLTHAVAHGSYVLWPHDGIHMFDRDRGDMIGTLGSSLVVPKTFAFAPGGLLALRPPSTGRMTGLGVWSLATGALASRGDADWGRFAFVAEDGTLSTARSDPQSGGKDCWVFTRGATADGAPIAAIDDKVWPPTKTKSRRLCTSQQQFGGKAITIADPPRGRLVTIPIGGGTGESFSVHGNAVVLKEASKMNTYGAPWFSGDGKWLVGKSDWNRLGVWELATGEYRSFTVDDKQPAILAGGDVSATEAVVASGDRAIVYDIQSGRAARTVRVPGPGAISAVAFGPGIVVAGTTDGRLAIARSTATPAIGTSPGGSISLVKVRRDGNRIATLSSDGAVRIWNGNAVLLATLAEFADGESLAFTPGGAYRGARESAERIGWVFDGPTEGFGFERFAAVFARPDLVTRRLADGRSDLATTVVRPPRVAWTTPTTTMTSSIKVGVNVEMSTKTGVLRAYVGGRPAASTNLVAATSNVTLDIPLEPGLNAIAVIAFDADGRSSNPRTFEIAGPTSTARPDIWVIAAGVGWYPSLPVADQLEGSVNDAYAIADVLAAQAGPGKRYANAHVTLLEDEQVTPDSIDKALAQLAKIKPTDVAVVFLAGHGVKLPTSDDMVLLTGAAKPDKATWATAGIGWTKIGTALARAKGRVIVLLDACHSGNVTQELIVPNTRLADHLVSTQRAGVLVFAASKGYQKSLEENAARGIVLDEDQKVQVKPKRVVKQPPPPPPKPTTPTAPRARRGNGYFSGAVVAALDSPSTDVNRNGVIEASELIEQVRLRVMKASKNRQTPWVARRELFGDFALATSAK